MYGDIKLKIRHAKRGNEKSLDLSNMGLSEIPIDITQLTMLESLNVSNNKLTNLKRIEQLPNLREINAANNQINQLHGEMLDMFSIETIQLYGNPVVNSNPQLAQIENDQNQLKAALQKHLGMSGSQGLTSMGVMGGLGGGLQSQKIGGGSQSSAQLFGSGSTYGLKPQMQNSYGQPSATQSSVGLGRGSNNQYSNSNGLGSMNNPSQNLNQKPTFTDSKFGNGAQIGAGNLASGTANFSSSFSGQADQQEVMALKRKISILENENKQLKEKELAGLNNDMQKKATVSNDDRNWMNSFGASGGGGQGATGGGRLGGIERPMTASSQNARVREVQEELKNEKKDKKKLMAQIENLQSEIQKQNFSAFTQAANVSVTSGRLPQVPGVREIQLEDIELGDKIAQGGFSVIHKGTLNGTPVAIKKIFDPRMTDELLQEIQNEIVMQSILRHPNIAILMGVIPKIPDIYIAFEYVSQGSLFDMLHMKKNQVEISVKDRIRIARDTAVVFQYMHHLGIVHRDIKSHNVLIDEGFTVKVCDFGLSKFIADLGKGQMQYAGTPTYMAPELFQKRAYDHKVDVFAFGSLLWEIINREVPYDGLDPQDIASNVIKGNKLKDHALAQIDPRLSSLVESCREVEQNKRPDFNVIVDVLNDIQSNM